MKTRKFQNETPFKKAIRDDANSRPGWSLDIKWQGWYSNAGISDLVGCHYMFFVSIETKNPNLTVKPTPLQKKWIRDKKEKSKSQFSFVVNNWDEWIVARDYVEQMTRVTFLRAWRIEPINFDRRTFKGNQKNSDADLLQAD